MKSGLRLARELTQQPSLQDFTGEELFPGKEISSDSEIEEWLRENCGSSYHPCGTCKMGVDSMSVVDSEGRVRGVEKLRIADASIMPLIPSANLNSPSMMIGEKGRRPCCRKTAAASKRIALLHRPSMEILTTVVSQTA